LSIIFAFVDPKKKLERAQTGPDTKPEPATA